jgi:hypothetical protein
LFGEGLASEVSGEDGLDLGEGIEPFEDGAAGHAILKAAVQLVAESVGKAGDFAFAGLS